MKRFLLLLIVGYQRLVSPLFGARCRFYPTCSEYARLALDAHGLRRGGWLAFKRLSRCGPWHPGGVDPVPDTATDGPASDNPPLAS